MLNDKFNKIVSQLRHLGFFETNRSMGYCQLEF